MKIKKIISITLLLFINSCFLDLDHKKSDKNINSSIKSNAPLELMKLKHFSNAKWSPNGDKIFFIHYDKTEKQRFYIYDMNKKIIKKISENNNFSRESVSWFDENYILEKGGTLSSSMQSDIVRAGPDLININDKKVHELPLYSLLENNDVIKVQDKLVLIDDSSRYDYFIFDLETKKLESITKEDFAQIKSIKIVPELGRIFILGKLKNQEQFKLFTVKVTGVKSQRTEKSIENLVIDDSMISPELSSDGFKLAYVRKGGPNTKVMIFDFNTNEETEVEKIDTTDITFQSVNTTLQWFNKNEKLSVFNKNNSLKYDFNIYDLENKNLTFIGKAKSDEILENNESVIFQVDTEFSEGFKFSSFNFITNEKNEILKFTGTNHNYMTFLYNGLFLDKNNTFIMPIEDIGQLRNSLNIINNSENPKILNNTCGYDWSAKQNMLLVTDCDKGLSLYDLKANKITDLINEKQFEN